MNFLMSPETSCLDTRSQVSGCWHVSSPRISIPLRDFSIRTSMPWAQPQEHVKKTQTSKDVFELKVELIMAGDWVIIDTGGIHMHMCSSLRKVSSYATYAGVCWREIIDGYVVWRRWAVGVGCLVLSFSAPVGCLCLEPLGSQARVSSRSPSACL